MNKIKRHFHFFSRVMVLIFFSALLLASCHHTTKEEQCMEMVKREKRRLPRNVAQGLVLDSIKYNNISHTLVYYHTISDSIYSDEMIAHGQSRLEVDLQNDIINSILLKNLKDEGVSFSYIYLSDQDKRIRMKFEFKNDDLKNDIYM